MKEMLLTNGVKLKNEIIPLVGRIILLYVLYFTVIDEKYFISMYKFIQDRNLYPVSSS